MKNAILIYLIGIPFGYFTVRSLIRSATTERSWTKLDRIKGVFASLLSWICFLAALISMIVVKVDPSKLDEEEASW